MTTLTLRVTAEVFGIAIELELRAYDEFINWYNWHDSMLTLIINDNMDFYVSKVLKFYT